MNEKPSSPSEYIYQQ